MPGSRKTPTRWLPLSFLALIGCGAGVLCLPGMTTRDIAFIDALFTAASAVCVTGLVVLDTQQDFTVWGQGVILLLIQFGGIGIITLASFLIISSHHRLSLGYEEMLSSTVAVKPHKNFRQITFAVVKFTLIIEVIGILLLLIFWPLQQPFIERLWHCVFHAVSAFCNAGFTLFANNLEDFTGHFGINLVLMILIILGGFGFINMQELIGHYRNRSLRWSRFSLLLKVSIALTLFLNIAGAVLLLLVEYRVALAALPLDEKILAALFHAVTTRTAGFNTLPLASFTDFSLLLMEMLMFCGGVSGSCAGGVKLGSVAVLIAMARAYVRHYSEPTLFNRRLSRTDQRKAMVLFLAWSFLVLGASVALNFFEGKMISHAQVQSEDTLALRFEVTSALGTVGLSTGITTELTAASKCVLILLMFIGRVGPLAIIAAWPAAPRPKPFTHPEETLPVG